jgi:hypothetical protein
VNEVPPVLRVVIAQMLGEERAEYPFADGAAKLGGRHPAMQRVRGDQLDIVDAGRGGELEDLLDDPLPDVGRPHRGKRQRDVVEDDRQPHPGAEQLRQRLDARRAEQRALDGLMPGSESGG